MTTTVIPSEPGEAGIPWWVWLLAALGGILVLAFITYCLYKVSFYNNRKKGQFLICFVFSAGFSRDSVTKADLNLSLWTETLTGKKVIHK